MWRNYKTSIGGFISLAIAVLIFVQKIINGESVSLTETFTMISALGGAITGLSAKDHNVTGGTVSQPTPTDPPPSVVLRDAIKDARASEQDTNL